MRLEIIGGKPALKSNGLVNAMSFAVQLETLKKKQRNIFYGFRGAQCAAVGGDGYGPDKYDNRNLSKCTARVQEACESLETRIKAVEEHKREKLETVSNRFASFIKLAAAADYNCSSALDATNKAWYEKYPWLKPPDPPKKKSWWQKFCDAVSSAVKAVGNFFKKIGNAIKEGVEWVVDKIKKGFKEIGQFIKDHYKAIIKYVVGAIVIAGCFVLSAVTCGAAAPIFAAAATAALTGGLTSLGVTVVTGVIEGKSFGEIFDDGASSFMTGAISGAVSSGLGALGGTLVGSIGNELFAQGAQLLVDVGSSFAGKVTADAVNYMIDNDGNLTGFFTDNDEYWNSVLGDALGSLGSGALGIVEDQLAGVAKDVLGDVWDAFEQTDLGKMVNDTIHFVSDTYDEAKDWLNAALGDAESWIQDTFGDAYQWAKDTYEQGKQWITDQVGEARDWVSDQLGEAKDWVMDQFGDAQEWISDQLGDAKGWVTDQLNSAQEWAKDTFGIDKLGDVMDIVKNPSEFAQHLAGDALESAFGTRSPQDLINNGLNQIAESMGLTDLADKLSSFNFSDLQISDLIPDLPKMPGVSEIANGINDTINGVVSNVSGIAADAQNAVNNAISGVTSSVNGIVSDVSGIASGAQNAVNNAIGNVTNTVNSVVNNVSGIAAGAQNAVNNAIGNATGAVNSAVSNVSSTVNSAINTSKDAVNSVIGGSFSNAVTSTVNQGVDYAKQAAQSVLGKLW